jgi:hypothetical protein
MLSHSRNRKSFYKDGMVPVQATAAVKKNKCKSVSRQVGWKRKSMLGFGILVMRL